MLLTIVLGIPSILLTLYLMHHFFVSIFTVHFNCLFTCLCSQWSARPRRANIGSYVSIHLLLQFSSVQLLSHVRLFDPMNCSSPGLPVHHQLPELAQTHVHQVDDAIQLPELAQTHIHQVGDAIQPSHPLSSPSPPAFSLSQHQSLFQWVSSSHQVAKVLELQLQHQCFRWIFRTDFL